MKNSLYIYFYISIQCLIILLLNHVNKYIDESFIVNDYEKNKCKLIKKINIPEIIEFNINNVIFYQDKIRIYGLFESELSHQKLFLPLENDFEIDKTFIECFHSKSQNKLIQSISNYKKKLEKDYYNIIFTITLLFIDSVFLLMFYYII